MRPIGKKLYVVSLIVLLSASLLVREACAFGLLRGTMYMCLKELLLGDATQFSDEAAKHFSRSVLSRVQKGYSKALPYLAEEHARDFENLKKYFPTIQPLTSPIKLEVFDKTYPEHGVHETPNGMTIYSTSALIKGVVRGELVGSITHAYKANTDQTLEVQDTADNLATTTQAEQALEKYYAVMNHGGFSEFDKEFEGGPDPILAFVDELASSKRQGVTFNYEMSILLLLAHEQGHVVLNHLPRFAKRNVTAKECIQMELEADRYAAYLLQYPLSHLDTSMRNSGKFPEIGVFMPDFEKSFFYLSYGQTGFVKSDHYPEPKQRMDAMSQGVSDASNDADNATDMTDKEIVGYLRRYVWKPNDLFRREDINKIEWGIILEN